MADLQQTSVFTCPGRGRPGGTSSTRCCEKLQLPEQALGFGLRDSDRSDVVKLQQLREHSCIGSVNVQQNHITFAQTGFLPGDVHSRLPQTRRRARLLSLRLEDVLKKHQTTQRVPDSLDQEFFCPCGTWTSGWWSLVCAAWFWLSSHTPTIVHVEPRPLSQKEQVFSNLLCYKQAKKNKCSLRRPLPRSDVPVRCCCGNSNLHFGPSP